MSGSATRLERAIGLALRAGVTASTVCLGAGLVLSLAGRASAADVLLRAGVIILLATPVTRVLISIVDYARERDWPFVALTAIVLVELMASAAAALLFNRRV